VAETECQAREILQHQLNQLKDDFAFILKSLRTNGYEVDEKVSFCGEIIHLLVNASFDRSN